MRAQSVLDGCEEVPFEGYCGCKVGFGGWDRQDFLVGGVANGACIKVDSMDPFYGNSSFLVPIYWT